MNRLAEETSPYLRQHAENPVDWYPWGPEALERAKQENKPIFLSIGYAACHWCHVMAHESFEDDETAQLMNGSFINIKVDREERPDLDAIYMQAVQAMTGHGGWPMTVFLTPEGAPFYGGTYFPPQDRHGLPSFRRLLSAVSDAWRNRRESVAETVTQLERLFESSRVPPASGELNPRMLELAFRSLSRAFDSRHGGFGGAPKFPPTMTLDFLLRHWSRTGSEEALDIVMRTYRAMMHGGIFDQIGGGLHRYSVDERWLVPHFEKMLYDNALFARLGVHLWQATGDVEVRSAAERTLEWALREMRSPEGGFYASLDADSEGEEGKFYLWDWNELDAVLGDDANVVRLAWGVSREGNFEGRNILFVPHESAAVSSRLGIDASRLSAVLARARHSMYEVRSKRPWPARDDKILAAWNGLLLRAIAEAARVFERDDFRDSALAAGEFLYRRCVRNGRALRSYKNGSAKGFGFLEDQAALGLGFLDLYSLTFDPAWFTRGRELAEQMRLWFFDPDVGVFFDVARDHERLITRPREVMDNATPSGTSLCAELLLRVGEFSDDDEYRGLAESIVRQGAELLARYPSGFGHLLGVADGIVHGTPEVALVGDRATAGFRELERCAAQSYVPGLVLAGGRATQVDHDIALLRERASEGGNATAFVCRRYVCDAPTRDPLTLRRQLELVGRVSG